MKQLLFILLLTPALLKAAKRIISKEEYTKATVENMAISAAEQKKLYKKVFSGTPLTPNEQTTWNMLQETNQIMHLYIKQFKNNS